MTIATGVAKVVAYKKQTTFGVIAPSGSGAQVLRRVSSTLSLAKQTYESGEIRTDYQRADFRHGVRSIAGGVDGELSPGTYAPFMAALLHRDFTAVTPLTAVALTIGTAVAGVYPLTRTAGDFLAGGIKIGQVIRLSVGTLNAANASKNLLIVGLTATIASVIPLNGVALFPEGPVANCTVTVVGKSTYTPTTGHTDDMFTIEHWFSDVAQSESFDSCKCTTIALDLPPTGMSTIKLQFMGRDTLNGTTQRFTNPTDAGTAGILAAVNGALVINGVPQALITGLSMTIDGEYSADPVVGSNTYPEIFKGRVIVKGQVTVLFQDGVVRDMFTNETEADMIAVFTTNNSATADFVCFTAQRIKFGGAEKSDGPKGLIQTMPFEALIQGAGGAGTAREKTTLVVQDSLAV